MGVGLWGRSGEGVYGVAVLDIGLATKPFHIVILILNYLVH
ncbi:MAG: hypothetical protein RXO76_01845 [Vulcanisaeta sp.]